MALSCVSGCCTGAEVIPHLDPIPQGPHRTPHHDREQLHTPTPHDRPMSAQLDLGKAADPDPQSAASSSTPRTAARQARVAEPRAPHPKADRDHGPGVEGTAVCPAKTKLAGHPSIVVGARVVSTVPNHIGPRARHHGRPTKSCSVGRHFCAISIHWGRRPASPREDSTMQDRLWLAPVAATSVCVLVGSPPWVILMCAVPAVASLAAVLTGHLHRRHSHRGGVR